MNFPELILISLIRRMMMDERSKITLKEIKRELITFKQANFSIHGTSYSYPDKTLERALRNLRKIRVVELINEKDIENAEILSTIDAETIRQVAE